MSEELRPCPICGKLPRHDISIEKNVHILTCCFGMAELDEKQINLKWNSAWCWKEIDNMSQKLSDAWYQVDLAQRETRKGLEEIYRLKAENKEVKETQLKFHEVEIKNKNLLMEIDKLKAEKEEMKKWFEGAITMLKEDNRSNYRREVLGEEGK
jgi:hypothetical protein